jgi:hypothetical protein
MGYIIKEECVVGRIRFAETDDLIDICLDNVFKAVFTRNTPESQGALSKLLSAIIGRELSVITISANEPPLITSGTGKSASTLTARPRAANS